MGGYRFVSNPPAVVWVTPFVVARGPRTRRLRFAPTGRLDGTVVLPDGFQPTAVDDATIIGVQRDEAIDVEYVCVYLVDSVSSGNQGTEAGGDAGLPSETGHAIMK
jgi:hypothetical protein